MSWSGVVTQSTEKYRPIKRQIPLRGIKCQANYELASLRIKNGIFGGVGYFLIYSDESLAGLPQYMVVGVE